MLPRAIAQTTTFNSYNWPAVLKSFNASATLFVIVFSPSRTHTRGS